MLNRVELIGNLGADPEESRLSDDRSVVNFTLATTDKWKDKNTGEKKEATEWHRITSFNQGLNKVLMLYCKKGSKVFIAGKLQTRKWQDQSGNDRYTTEVVLNVDCKLLLLSSKSRDKGGDYNADDIPQHNEIDDEIPF